MDAFAENAPVLVEGGDGHELIDVDGRRYLDAISSLWVNTLRHHVPELDDAVRAQLERGAHSTTPSARTSNAGPAPRCSATGTSWSRSWPKRWRAWCRSLRPPSSSRPPA